MKQITKTVQQIGNGAHIYLPKEMVGQKVVVTLVKKTLAEIEQEILMILRPYLRHSMGIYVYGSYAREEQTPESDIDILVITDGKVKIHKKIHDYEIIAISLEQLEKTIEYTAVLILPILKEAKAIVNSSLLEKYKKEKLTKKNARWYIETTESALAINKEWISEKDMKSMPAIVYSLIMRLKGLYVIESLILNKDYSNKEIIDYLTKEGITKANQIYRMYSEHRDEKRISDTSLNYDDISKLYDIVVNYFHRVRLVWEKLE